MAFDVKALPNYVAQNSKELLVKAYAGSKTADLLTMLVDVVGPKTLNMVSTDAQLQDGKNCGWNPQGDTVFSQRTITPEVLKVNNAFCPQDLIDKYLVHEIRVGAGKETMPYEQAIAEGYVASVAEQIEGRIWVNDEDSAGGLLGLARDDAAVIKPEAVAGAYNAIKAVYMAIPSKIINKADTVIFVGQDTFREYVQDLIAANLYHYNPSDVTMEYVLPGTATRVIGVPGLDGTKKIFAGRLSNMFLATDLASDRDEFKFWFSEDADEFRLKIRFSLGVQYAFSDEIVLGGIA